MEEVSNRIESSSPSGSRAATEILLRTRRSLLFSVAAGAGMALTGRASQAAESVGPRSADEGELRYGSRSPFERAERQLFPTENPLSSWSLAPLAEQVGIITPSGLHFERHHAGVPRIDPGAHSLTLHGHVKRPKRYSLADLKRFPAVTRFHFIECAGNGFTEWQEPSALTVQGTHGLFSTSEWTGVPFSILADEVGLKPRAAWVLAESADDAMFARSIPVEKLLRDGFIAYGQNGEAIRPEQGYPLRLIVPGSEGSAHVKWLRRLEFSDKPFMTREDTSKYTSLGPDGMARMFTYTMEAKSVITFPSGGMTLPDRGFWEITGFAWSGRGRISTVDVSTDGGGSWGRARLEKPILAMCATRFRFPWKWSGRPAILQSRCSDEAGYVQPTLAKLVSLRGRNGVVSSVYHLNAIQSWAVGADGTVRNVHA
jgi:sulfane dehydrogenase subunit SoxC